IKSLSFDKGQTTVYNLEVEDSHTYAVGPNGILVHNKGEKAEEAEVEDYIEPLTEQVLIVPEQEWNT
ncbi:MAG: hypothetical protein GTN53_41755, partial [Candidatus Aminicenantes bacterium]|nr:hypothetical protein [Candidatus Aminicenantes bacterium]NIQ73021.1 hypothetical protein [Candidatus Aminicenantes bacterium]NIT29044.1 hypothetical protein [Candidatus Aminicenantes bacterium]